MAVPRPALFAMLGVVLILAAFVATRNAGQTDDPGTVTAAPTQAPKTPEPRAERGRSRAGQGPSARRDPEPARRRPASPRGVPARVARAIARNEVVVLFFSNARGTDEIATRRAIARLGNRRRVAIFADRLANLGNYSRVIAGLGVSQAPAVVIVRRNRKARVLEGFVDDGSLRQHVADALR